MAVKVGINGFGRIGKCVVRAAINNPDVEVVAINATGDNEGTALLLKYDSVHGTIPNEVTFDDENIYVDGKKIRVFHDRDASKLPWSEEGVEIVMECTGKYRDAEEAKVHLNQPTVKKVLISAPGKNEDLTMVMGVNQDMYDPAKHHIISNASCTTNCLAPLCKVLEDKFGIEKGLMSTIHAATSKQKTVDGKSTKDWRIGRSVFGNIIPTSTGAAKAVGLVIPEVAGKLTGLAFRVPTADVSVVDLNVVLKTATTLEEVKAAVKEASETYMKGILEYMDDECVTSDFIGDANTSIFDARQGIQLDEKFFKFLAYYDNEFGYSSKILNLIEHMSAVDNK